MKNKFISLLLVTVMLFAVVSMTSCGEQDVNPFEKILPPTTITLISIRGENTTDEAIAAVEKELNVITRAEYNVNLKLVLYSEAEYEAKLAERMLAAEAEKQPAEGGPTGGGIQLGTSKEEAIYETIEKDGFVEFVYPDVTENQLDIFLIRDQATYTTLANEGKLQNLTTQIADAYANMAKYINKTLRDAMKIDKKTFAIPNNHTLGSYTYMLLNKSLVDELGYDPADLKDLYALSGYLADVKAKKPDYAPLLNCADPAVATFAEGTMIGVLPTTPDLEACMPTVLLKNEDYAKHLAAKQAYAELDYLSYGTFNSATKCGATFVTGLPASIDATYGAEYYTVPFAEPMINVSDLFSSMYAISATTADTNRCLDIISLLNTNAEFRNIFQYGVEGVHYDMDEDTDTVTITSDDYNMNTLYTGNSYLLYPNDRMSASELDLMASRTYAEVKEVLGDTLADPEWVGEREHALAKCLNNSAKKSPYFGFVINPDNDEILAGQLNSAKNSATSALETLKTTNTYAAFIAANPDGTVTEYVSQLKDAYLNLGTVLGNNPMFKLILSDAETAPAGIFMAWYIEQYPEYAPEPEAPEGGEDAGEGGENTPAA